MRLQFLSKALKTILTGVTTEIYPNFLSFSREILVKFLFFFTSQVMYTKVLVRMGDGYFVNFWAHNTLHFQLFGCIETNFP